MAKVPLYLSIIGLLITGSAAYASSPARTSKCRQILKEAPKANLTIDEHWQMSGLSLDSLADKLDFNQCRADKDSFLQCLTFLNGLVQDGKPSRLLLPTSQLAEYAEEIDAVDSVYGPFSLVRIRTTGGAVSRTVEENVLLNVARQKSFRQKTRALYGAKFDLDPIIKDIFALVRASGREAIQVAAAYNAILKLSDARAHLEPTSFQTEIAKSHGVAANAGLGLRVRGQGKRIYIAEVFPGSPAAYADLRVDDALLAYDGKAIINFDVDAVHDDLKGAVGTPVTLTIQRGERKFDLTVYRQVYQLPNVISELRLDGKGSPTGYIRLDSFMSPDSCKDVKSAILNLQSQGAKQLILDLRGNGGGLLSETICIAGLFLGKGELVATVESVFFSEPEIYRTNTQKVTDLPLVVLVDADSASGSEFIAGAFRDLHRAWIVGERTRAKGSVQSALGFDDDDYDKAKILIYSTTGRFHQPSGSSNQLVGISPNFEVFRTPDQTQEVFIPREGDFYPNALPSSTKKWKEDRPEELAVLKECLEKEGVAEANWRILRRQGKPADYQLLRAIDILNCQY